MSNNNEKPKKKIGRIVLIVIASTIVLLCLTLRIVFGMWYRVSIQVGSSMMPTTQNGDRLIYEKVTNGDVNINRGDIVLIDVKEELLKHGSDASRSLLIKRIVGIEGDRIEIKYGKVFVNKKDLEEKYLFGSSTEGANYSEVVVPQNHYYFLGDNRKVNGSIDSRVLGTVDASKIVGKIKYRLYPFEKFGTLP